MPLPGSPHSPSRKIFTQGFNRSVPASSKATAYKGRLSGTVTTQAQRYRHIKISVINFDISNPPCFRVTDDALSTDAAVFKHRLDFVRQV